MDPIALPPIDAISTLFEEYSPESLEKYAGLSEHPDVTRERLIASGEWDRGLKDWVRQEIAKQTKLLDGRNPGLRAEREVWRLVQKQYPPPDGTTPIPLVAEQKAALTERARQKEQLKAEQDVNRKSRPPKLRDFEEARFARIDEELAKSGGLNPIDDAMWIYQNIDNDSVRASDAPNRGAWSGLFQARFYRNQFYEKTMPLVFRALEKRKGDGVDVSISPGEKKAVAEIEAMIEAAVKASGAKAPTLEA